MPKIIDLGIVLPELKHRKGLYVLVLDVAKELGVHTSDILSRSQKQQFVDARREFAARAHFQHRYTMTKISQFLGHKDHTTVSHYLKTQDDGNVS